MKNLYWADCKDVIPNLDPVDLVYLDPPFNTGKDWGAFDDSWGNIIQEGRLPIINIESSSMRNYLLYMQERLKLLKNIIKATGSIYLHCDPTVSHYLKIIMDGIFGRENFRNEIVWCYPPNGKAPSTGFHRKHDVVFYYSKSNKPYFQNIYKKFTNEQIARFSIDNGGRRYKTYSHPDGKSRKVYLDNLQGSPIPDWWTDVPNVNPMSKERLGYPTQKPLALLDRIIAASCPPGGVVLDPFCGSGTTLEAAQKAGRKWIGIDRSKEPIDLCKERLSHV